MVKVIVCVKQALDVAEIKIDREKGVPITAGVPLKTSDFDKNAVEEAVRLKEKLGGEVVIVTVGSKEATSTIKEALAMGGDRGYLVTDPAFERSDTLALSKILAGAIRKIGGFDIVLCGEASIDSFSFQVGPRLAEKLGVPQITYVHKLEVKNGKIVAERSVEEGLQVVETQTPVLVTVTKEINEPRTPTFMDIVKAAKKPLETLSLADINVKKEEVGEEGSGVKVVGLYSPPMERKNIVIEGETVEEKAEKLAETLIKEGIVG